MSYFHKFVKFCKAKFTVLPKINALAPTNRRFTEKNWLSWNTGSGNSGQPRVPVIQDIIVKLQLDVHFPAGK